MQECERRCQVGYAIGEHTTAAREAVAARKQVRRTDGQRIGSWEVLGRFGEGREGGVVYAAQLDSGDTDKTVAVKFPVSEGEVDHHSLVQDLPGVPSIVETGKEPDGHFIVMPALVPSLEEILLQCDHDGLGGRISWAAARGLGLALLTTLRGIHARGLVHCDIKPANVLCGPDGDPWPQLIDFGSSRAVGAAGDYEGGAGTRYYNSIRAGFTNERAQRDDLESLGWLLLRCVLGHLPWRMSPEEQAQLRRASEEAKLEENARVSLAKEQFLDQGGVSFGDRFDYFPAELEEYLRRVRTLGSASAGAVATDIDYQRLVLIFASCADNSWERLMMDIDDLFAPDWPIVARVKRRKVLWMPLEPNSQDEGLELEASKIDVPRGLCLRLTGRNHHCETLEWLELDPVWAPGLPECLLDGGWLLGKCLAVEKRDGTPPSSSF